MSKIELPEETIPSLLHRSLRTALRRYCIDNFHTVLSEADPEQLTRCMRGVERAVNSTARAKGELDKLIVKMKL